jgi:hypothetical protein
MEEKKLILENKDKNNFLYRNPISVQNSLNLCLHLLCEKNKLNEKSISSINTNETVSSPEKNNDSMSKIKSISFDHLEEFMYPKMNFKQSASNVSISEDYDMI